MQPTNDLSATRILIVDDQPANVRLLEFTLRRAGFEAVSSTMEPRSVIGLHQEHRFEVILLDLQMPEMNGHEVLKELREIRESHPVVILVISADHRQAAVALAEGADGFLEKPFRLPDVVERVKLLLESRPAEG